MNIVEGSKYFWHEGYTTTPAESPWWVGSRGVRVAFDFLYMGKGLVAIHALFGDLLEKTHREFFYKIVSADEAVATAQKVVESAKALIAAYDMDALTLDDDERGLDFAQSVNIDIFYETAS